MPRNFSEIFFAAPEKLNPEFKIWNIRLGLTTSADATIQCAIEFQETDLRKDLANIQVRILILYGVKDRVCLFVLAQVMHENIKGSQLVQIEKADHGFYFEELQIFNLELVKFIDYQSFFMIKGLWVMGSNHPGNDNYERYT